MAEDHDHAELQFSDIPSCIQDFAAGKFLIVLDSPSRENEGDLIIAARHLTPEKAAFLIRHSSGYVCVPMSPTRAQKLDLPAMVPLSKNSDPRRTNYTVSADAVGRGVTTGISAQDRSATCNVLAEESTEASHLIRPGHILPLIARAGGVRERRGHTEAAWELSRLAGIQPAVAAIGELVLDGEADGEGIPAYTGSRMMHAQECVDFGRRWGIRCCTIEDLVQFVEGKEGPLNAP